MELWRKKLLHRLKLQEDLRDGKDITKDLQANRASMDNRNPTRRWREKKSKPLTA